MSKTGCRGTVPPGREACGRRLASAAKRRVRISLSRGFVAGRACECECKCECECGCARARSPESGVGGCACMRAGLQEARLSWPPEPTSWPSPGREVAAAARAAGPPVPQPGQCVPGPAQVTRRWPRVIWDCVGARESLLGTLEIPPKPCPGGRGPPGVPAPRSAQLPHHLLLTDDSVVSRAEDFKLKFLSSRLTNTLSKLTGKSKARERPGFALAVLKSTGSFGLCRTSMYRMDLNFILVFLCCHLAFDG